MIKIVQLPDLPPKGDVDDFRKQRLSQGQTPDEIRDEIERLAAAVEPFQLEAPTLSVDAYEPFPVDALPEPVATFIKIASGAVGCSVEYVVLPLLAVLGAAIGNSRRLQLKPGWDVPPIIWTATVSASGTAKTPALRVVRQAVDRRQARALERYVEEKARYEKDLARWEKAYASWKKGKDSHTDPPVKPEQPYPDRYVVSDITVEAIAEVLSHNPRGVCLIRDELQGWVGSFDRYAKGQGSSDESQWLSMYNGEPIYVDRVTRDPLDIHRASVCITGGIQPEVAKRVFSAQRVESGLVPRLLMAYPPRRKKRWTEEAISAEILDESAELVNRLYDLDLARDEKGHVCPAVLTLTPEARSAYVDFFNEHNEQAVSLDGGLAATWSKLEETAARLALIVHLVRSVVDDPTLLSRDEVDAESMTAGIAMARWFGREAKRVYALLTESEDEKRDRELVEWIRRRGGVVTAARSSRACGSSNPRKQPRKVS